MNFSSIVTNITNVSQSINTLNPLQRGSINYAGFNAQQAIEKSLKYILCNVYGNDIVKDGLKTHDISALASRIANNHDMSFYFSHQDLFKMSNMISTWAVNARYYDIKSCTIDNVKKALYVAEGLFIEVLSYEINNSNTLDNIKEVINENPINIKWIPYNLQNIDIVMYALDTCKYFQNVNPEDLLIYVDEKFKDTVKNYPGYWIRTPDGDYVWRDD